MALKPQIDTTTRVTQTDTTPEPSKTYGFDFTTGEVINGYIDGTDALRQFIVKAIATARFRFPIYNSEYGCETQDIIGQDVGMDLLRMEIPRAITEALVYDDRINSVSNFVIDRKGDELYVTFDVSTNVGVISQEVTL